MTPTDADVEVVARAICNADALAPEADAPIYIGVKQAAAWEGRIFMARAAIAADPGRKRMREALEIIARMKVHPDGKVCQMTLAAAIETARKAVEGADRG